MHVLSPNGGETLTIGSEVNLQWDALVERNVVGLDLFISRPGERRIVDPIAIGVPNTGSYIWIVTGPSADVALSEAIAYDGEGHAATEMSVAVPRESRARVSVYDLRGRTVDVLVDGVLPPGRASVVWDCGATRGGVSSGVSFVKMEAPGKEITKKVVLAR